MHIPEIPPVIETIREELMLSVVVVGGPTVTSDTVRLLKARGNDTVVLNVIVCPTVMS